MVVMTTIIARTTAAILTTTLVLGAVAVAGAQPASTKIGMVKTFLAEQPKAFIEIATDDFKVVLKKTTGFDGDIVGRYDAFEIAQKLDAKELDFALFHAHEFAWVRQKYPELQALMVAANQRHAERAHLIVHKNSAVKSFADLRGKKLDMPVGTKEHCRMFLQKLCAAAEPKGPMEFFGSIAKSPTRNDALDQVARDKVQATIVDTQTLDFYKEVKPAVFEKNLRVLLDSEVFPPAVIAYKPGNLDAKKLDQFRDGLLRAHTIPEGRDMMKSWNVDAFEAPRKQYSESLAEIMKAYPPPAR